MTETITLNWNGPYNLRQFMGDEKLNVNFHESGVYCWVIDRKEDTELEFEYIGRATHLHNRMAQHYMNMVSGRYRIPARFRDDKDWNPDWRNKKVSQVFCDKEKYKELIDIAFEFTACCKVYLHVEKNHDVKIIERNLLYNLKPTGTTWGTVSKPPVRCCFKHIYPDEILRDAMGTDRR